MGRTVGETSAHAEKAAKKAVTTVSKTESSNEGNNNQGGTNQNTSTQNNNQSNGVVNNSGGSPRGDSNVFGIGTNNPNTNQVQQEFRQLTQNFASFLDSSLGKLTQVIAETVGGQERSVSQELDNGINEDGHGDGENQQPTGNCVMVGHTQNCYYTTTDDTEADPSTNTEYGDRPDWDDNTFNVEDAENQDMPYGTWDDTEVNTEGKDTGFVSPEPTSPSDHVDSITWLKTLGILPVLAIGGGIIYFARRKK